MYSDMMPLALNIASYSTCVRSQVGAVYVHPRGHILTLAYNKERKGLNCSEGDCPRGQKDYAELPAYSEYSDCIADHAEIIAMHTMHEACNQAVRGGTMYVTRKPCQECQVWLDKCGIKVEYPGKPSPEAMNDNHSTL